MDPHAVGYYARGPTPHSPGRIAYRDAGEQVSYVQNTFIRAGLYIREQRRGREGAEEEVQEWREAEHARLRLSTNLGIYG